MRAGQRMVVDRAAKCCAFGRARGLVRFARRINALLFAGVLAGALAACDAGPAEQSATASGTVTDMRGREVAIPGEVGRIAIDDSRYLVALSLIDPKPVARLAAWGHDANRLGDASYAGFIKQSPELAGLPRIASSAENFDVESLIASRPDAAVLSTESGVTDEQIARVEAAGIPVVVLDFFSDPLDNLEPSMMILGRLIGREDEARAFLDFRREHLDAVAQKVRGLPENERPLVFFEAHAGSTPDCCNSAGRGNVSDYLEFVGAHNIGADAIPQSSGKLNLEYVIARNPEFYIATGGPHLAERGGLVIGEGYDENEARRSLEAVASRRGIAQLDAVRNGRAFGFSHQLLNSPLDIVAVETFAKWLHPELFADLSPERTLSELNQRFLAVPYEGRFWVALDPERENARR
ncbi:MAG: ABC transporter substrate-binding protein [Erythrobacter sp.]|nr:ABC transporter substrate-binding protein [Erythrobacter sp.]